MVVFSGLTVYLIPLWILDWNVHLFPLEIGVFRFFGLAPIILGIVTMAGFIWGWVLSGTGSPLQFDMPNELIVRGSYRFVRNPMYVGYFFILLNEAATRRNKMTNRCILPFLPDSGHYLKRRIHHASSRDETIQ